MSVDTKVRLKGYVEIEAILEFVRNKFDANADIFMKSITEYDDDVVKEFYEKGIIADSYAEKPYIMSGYVVFNYNNSKRMMFVSYDSLNFSENLKFYKSVGLEDMVNAETTFLNLGYNDDAVKIMTEIVKAYGGWIDYNDSDDEEYVYFEAGAEVPKKVRHVTMKEVYEKFGEVVIID
jgi:hypothetical protein